MLKKIISILPLISIFIAFLAIYFAKSSSELVYVDVNKLIEGYSRTKTAKAEFDKKATTMKGNIDSLVSGWQKELKDFEKQRSSMTAKELKLKQELLQNKQQQITGYQEEVQKQIREENKKVTQTVINDINDYLKVFGKKHGYKIIFGASGGGNIMYAEDSADLTKEVLKGLNIEYGGKK